MKGLADINFLHSNDSKSFRCKYSTLSQYSPKYNKRQWEDIRNTFFFLLGYHVVFYSVLQKQ